MNGLKNGRRQTSGRLGSLAGAGVAVKRELSQSQSQTRKNVIRRKNEESKEDIEGSDEVEGEAGHTYNDGS